jgi:hypothetical protein
VTKAKLITISTINPEKYILAKDKNNSPDSPGNHRIQTILARNRAVKKAIPTDRLIP